MYVKSKDEVFALYMLMSFKQEAGEPTEQFLHKPRSLLGGCNYEVVTDEEEALCDAFIQEIMSSTIRQRLLERKTLDLKSAIDITQSLEQAQRQSYLFHEPAELSRT